MRWTALLAMSVATSVGPSLTGCGEPGPEAKKLQQKLGETWGAMKSWGIEKKDAFVASASPRFDELKQKFADAKLSASETGAGAARSLESDWGAVQQKFDAMKTSTGEQWARHRDAFVDAYEAFQKKLAETPAK